MKATSICSFSMLFIIAMGCEVPDLDKPESSSNTVQVKPALEEPKKEDTRLDMSGIENEPPPTTATPREFTHKDPEKGKRSRQAGGYLGAVGNARFAVTHKVSINLYKKAMEFYRATNGHYPKTHEVFMKEVIRANKIKLPKLEKGDEYLYDPADHTLKIYRPGA